MSSIAELTAVCAEFQENFAVLNAKYTALSTELEAERAGKEKLKKAIEGHIGTIERKNLEVAAIKEERDDLLQYKEKYYAASVSVEHLKGRLETARRGVADNISEHEQETEQLRSQIRDLLQRIEVSGDAAQMTQLRNQSRELEERAALLAGQLIEEKERHAHELLAAHAALRDSQGRNLELEQRYRALDSEVTQMRSTLRRSLDLQNDAAAQREKAVLEANRTAVELQLARKQIEEYSLKLQNAEGEMTERLERAQGSFESERAEMQERLRQMMIRLDEAAAEKMADAHKLISLQASVQSRVNAVREECLLELQSAQKARTEAKEEALRLASRLKGVEHELAEQRRAYAIAEGRVKALEAERSQLHAQLEKAVQMEAWEAAERDRARQELSVAQAKINEFEHMEKKLESSSLEVDRLRLQLQYRELDVVEARKTVEHVQLRAKDSEEAFEKRCNALYRQLHTLKKQLHHDANQGDQNRKKLLRAIERKDTELASVKLSDERRHGVPFERVDVVGLLQPLADEAAALRERIVSLTKAH
jgi:chromosome segregation ATPase